MQLCLDLLFLQSHKLLRSPLVFSLLVTSHLPLLDCDLYWKLQEDLKSPSARTRIAALLWPESPSLFKLQGSPSYGYTIVSGFCRQIAACQVADGFGQS